MTDTSNMPDDQRQRIIEAAMLLQKLRYLELSEEWDRVNRALEAALASLNAGATGINALLMVQCLLDGKGYAMTSASGNPNKYQLCIDVAHAIGARVEDSRGPFDDGLPSCLRTLLIYPPCPPLEGIPW